MSTIWRERGRKKKMNENTVTIKAKTTTTNTVITAQLAAYAAHLREEECSRGTIEKYLRDVRTFAQWLGARELTKETAVEWKEQLSAKGYAPVTINSMLSALNGFFTFIGRGDCHVKFLKIQRRMFRAESKALTREEYMRLVSAAESRGDARIALLLETICATGVRVSEVRYITVEAARQGVAEISLKGKIRTIIIPGKLRKKLLKYAGKRKIASGEIFLTKSGRGMNRRQIWAAMKALCGAARVESSKVFPHNLRHLFACRFYMVSHDIVRLANILGHSSIETTRIYLVTTSNENAEQMELLGLVS